MCIFVLVTNNNLVIFFFFFQAEDGIRDIGVTGVQTCALPIFTSAKESNILYHYNGDGTFTDVTDRAGLRGRGWAGDVAVRSEERRVGKECRSRWAPYH